MRHIHSVRRRMSHICVSRMVLLQTASDAHERCSWCIASVAHDGSHTYTSCDGARVIYACLTHMAVADSISMHTIPPIFSRNFGEMGVGAVPRCEQVVESPVGGTRVSQ